MMRRHGSAIGRYAVALFGGYLLLFLLRHDPFPRAVPGLLAVGAPGYMRAVAQSSPAGALSRLLGIPVEALVSAGLLAALVCVFVVYVRLLRIVRVKAPRDDPRRHTKTHEEEDLLGEMMDDGRWTIRRRLSSIVYRQRPERLEDSMGLVSLPSPSLMENLPPQRSMLVGIMAGALLFSLPLLLWPYLFSRDIYSYIIYGRMAALYGANPALAAPSAFANDRFFPYLIAWQSTPSVYGPLWALFSHALTLLVERAGGAPWLYVLAYKLAMLVAHLANTALIWAIAREWRPGQQAYAALLYGWNPLALIEFAGSAHNDVLMISLVLLAVWCAQRGRWRLALAVLLGAALVKWVAALLLPLWAICWLRGAPAWRGRLARAGSAAAILGAAALLLYLPYGHVLESIGAPLRAQAGMAAENSLGALAIRGGQEALIRVGLAVAREPAWRAAAEEVVASCSKALLVLAWLAALWVVWRRPDFERMLQASFWLLLALLLIAPIFRVWYVTWPLALAALLDWRPAGRAILGLAAVAPLMYVVTEAPAWLDALKFLPLIVLLAYEILLAHRRRAANTLPAPAAVAPR